MTRNKIYIVRRHVICDDWNDIYSDCMNECNPMTYMRLNAVTDMRVNVVTELIAQSAAYVPSLWSS